MHENTVFVYAKRTKGRSRNGSADLRFGVMKYKAHAALLRRREGGALASVHRALCKPGTAAVDCA